MEPVIGVEPTVTFVAALQMRSLIHSGHTGSL